MHPSIHPSIHLLTAFPLQGPIWAFIGSVPWQHSKCVLAPLLTLAHLLTFVCNWGLNQEHSTSQSSPIQTKLSPPQSYHHPRATTMHTTKFSCANVTVIICVCLWPEGSTIRWPHIYFMLLPVTLVQGVLHPCCSHKIIPDPFFFFYLMVTYSQWIHI